MLSWWSQSRFKDAYTRDNLTSKTSTHPTPGINPFSALQSLRPWLPFPILYKGCGEESQQSNSVWVAPKHQVSQAYPTSNPTLTVWKPITACCSRTNSSELCEEGKYNKVTTQTKRVNTAQVRQDDSELFLALAWPKQISSNAKDTRTHNNPKPGMINNPIP